MAGVAAAIVAAASGCSPSTAASGACTRRPCRRARRRSLRALSETPDDRDGRRCLQLLPGSFRRASVRRDRRRVEAAVALVVWRGRPLRPLAGVRRGSRHDPLRRRRLPPGRPLRAERRAAGTAGYLDEARHQLGGRSPRVRRRQWLDVRRLPRARGVGGRDPLAPATGARRLGPDRLRRASRSFPPSSARAGRPTSRRVTSSSRCRSSPPSSEWRSRAFPGALAARRIRRRRRALDAGDPRPAFDHVYGCWGSRSAVAAPAAWLRQEVEDGDVLYPVLVGLLAALPQAGEARRVASRPVQSLLAALDREDYPAGDISSRCPSAPPRPGRSRAVRISALAPHPHRGALQRRGVSAPCAGALTR